MKGLSRAWLCTAFLVLLPACSTFVSKPMLASPSGEHLPQKIALFFDGTNNSVASDTNIKRLHSLISLQERRDVSTLYIEGVGVDSDVLGMGTGYGIGPRVRLAYAFLLRHYHKDDQIYLFGFSRGAYSARILASLLNYAGLPATPVEGTEGMDAQQHAGQIAEEAYSRMKADFWDGKVPAPKDGYTPAKVTVLGLWDTVEALGMPDWYHRILHKTQLSPYDVNIDVPNRRYGDQLCNVEHAYQALAIDDDREWIFTPLPLGREHLYEHCKDTQLSARLPEEVWFSGAHSDVGGGYGDSELSGVSLNWMITVMERDKLSLLPPHTRVRQDPFGTSHDPEAGWWSPLYHKVNRNIGAYALRDRTEDTTRQPLPALAGTLCVHPSVFERRKAMPPKDHENRLLTLQAPGTIYLRVSNNFGKPAILQETDSKQDGSQSLRVLQWSDSQGCQP